MSYRSLQRTSCGYITTSGANMAPGGCTPKTAPGAGRMIFAFEYPSKYEDYPTEGRAKKLHITCRYAGGYSNE